MISRSCNGALVAKIGKIDDGNYSFDFLKIILTQMKGELPVQYSGPGSIFFAEAS